MVWLLYPAPITIRTNRAKTHQNTPTSDYFIVGIHREIPKGLKGLKIGKEKPPEGGGK